MGGGTLENTDVSRVVTWTQTSWLTENYISGFNEIGNSGHTEDSSGYSFNGLGKSASGSCAIDGDGHSHTNWFNCVGVINKIWGAMPGPLRKTATTMKLYIWSSDN